MLSASSVNRFAHLLLALEQQAAAHAPAPPHASFLDALRNGDSDAWRRLFEEEMPAIFRYARSRLGSHEDAEDVTNQVFAEAWRGIKRYRDEGLPLRAWLFGIARNVAGSHRRRFMARNAQLSADSLDLPDDSTIDRAAFLDLVNALQAIEASQAEVVALRFVHGLSLEETASVLKTSVDAVKGRQKRALVALRERLGA
jgi:RNA polymerase sigma-70 factor (ECF subfamily)